MFQSHAGSIEAGCGSRACDPLPRFQSHAGSIEALPDHMYPLAAFCFNPTLVRLRRLLRNDKEMPQVGFQSHAGSIEASRPPGGRLGGDRVSIPRWFD